MLNAGVIGVGAMGFHHARVYNELDNVNFVAISDPNEDSLQRISRRYQVACYTDYQTMLQRENLDLVTVAVPTTYHAAVATEALMQGVHVLVEKPIAASVTEGLDLVQVARNQNRILTVGHIERFNPAVVALKQHLEEGRLGEAFQIHARRFGPLPRRITDTGVSYDLATHDLDIMHYLLGSEIVRLYAETSCPVRNQHQDMLSGLLRFQNGCGGILDINWLTPTKVRELSIVGERGMYVVNYLTQDLYFYENPSVNGYGSGWDTLNAVMGVTEGNMTRFQIMRKEPLRAELEAFSSAVEHGSAAPVDPTDALSALNLAHWLVISGNEGRPIFAEEIKTSLMPISD